MLTQDQALAFARDGFLQLPAAVDAATCSALVAETWAALPRHWRPHDPASWTGVVGDSCHAASVDERGGHLKYQIKALAEHPHVVASFQPGSPLHGLATELIGKPLHRIRLRGLYVVAPSRHPRPDPRAPAPHVEAHAAQIIALCYLDDVAPGGGGLLVWPGSHHDFYPAFASKLDYVAGPDLAAVYARHRQLRPVELPGGRGDVVLIHHRLLHSPSINRARRLRLAFLCDYTTLDYPELCRQAPGADPFEDWPGLRTLVGATPVAPARCRPWAWWQRLRWPRRWRAAPPSPSTINKADASRLARQRRPGDVWLVISDSPVGFGHASSLDPQGSDLAAAGIVATIQGQRVVSQSRGDITVQLPEPPAGLRLELTGVDRPLWLRVLALQAPFAQSRILHAEAIAGDQARVSVALGAPATTAT